MRKIEQPNDVGESAIQMHVAEFLLAQAEEILANILTAPKEATPAPIYERVKLAHLRAGQAVSAFQDPDLRNNHESQSSRM